MRRVLAGGALVALMSASLVLQPSDAEPAHAGVNGGGLGWQYHSSTGSYYRQPGGDPGGGGPTLRPTTLTDWGKPDSVNYECPAEPYDESAFEKCDDVTWAFCNSTPGENKRPVAPMVIWKREFPDDNPDTENVQEGEPSPWQPDPGQADDEPPPGHAIEYCHEYPEENVVTKREVHNVNYEIFQDLTGLEIEVQPEKDNKTLVNFNTIAFTRYPENVNRIPEVKELLPGAEPKPRIRIEGEVVGKVERFQYTIEAEADLNWTFQDAVPAKATGRGQKYDGTSPNTAPAGHYVLAKFRHTGTKTIELGAGWNGTIDIDAPGEGPHPIDPVNIDSVSETVQVVEKLNVHVD